MISVPIHRLQPKPESDPSVVLPADEVDAAAEGPSDLYIPPQAAAVKDVEASSAVEHEVESAAEARDGEAED